METSSHKVIKQYHIVAIVSISRDIQRMYTRRCSAINNSKRVAISGILITPESTLCYDRGFAHRKGKGKEMAPLDH